MRVSPPGRMTSSRIRHPGRIEQIGEHILRQLLRAALSGGALRGKALRRTDDLIAAAVVQAEIHLYALVFLRAFHSLLRLTPQLRRQARQVAEKAESHTVAVHVADCLAEVFLQQVHNGVHLVLRALPVLRGEGVDRQVLQADALGIICDRAERLRARLMSCRTRQATLLCPTAVAVHDDGDVGRDPPAAAPERSFFGIISL